MVGAHAGAGQADRVAGWAARVRRGRDSILVLFALLFTPAASAQSVSDVPSARVGTQVGGMHVDGVLDEPAWNTAEPLSTFTMIEPSEDKAPTSATTVRALVSATEILIGIYNHNVRQFDDRWQLDSNQLLVKMQYAFRH
jgi:hypothetical protein